jgi:transposase-like protein
VSVDHATISRWVLKDALQREEPLHRRKHPVGIRWRMMRPVSTSKASGAPSIAL